jgi:hypothetical protein
VKSGSSWLCPTANHRERFLDMQERLRTARIVTLTVLSATAAIVSATGSWIMLAAAAVAVLAVAIGGIRLEQRRRPEASTRPTSPRTPPPWSCPWRS